MGAHGKRPHLRARLTTVWAFTTRGLKRVSDDCDPLMFSGEIGPAVVVVGLEQGRAGGANIPLGDKPVPASSPWSASGRADISFDRTLTDDTVLAAPGCSASVHSDASTVNATSQSIDVEYTLALTGLGNCSGDSGEPAHDCTSDRIFHFEWLHACGGMMLSTCQ